MNTTTTSVERPLDTSLPVTRDPSVAHSARRSPFLVRTIRSWPRLYSAICRGRLFYSRQVAGADARAAFTQHRNLFAMDEFEARHVNSLQRHGYALAPEYFPADLIGSILSRADGLFRRMQVDPIRAYSVQDGHRKSLAGLTYEEVAATEKMIALRDPLLHIPELLDVAFHKTILKIAAGFLGCVPPLYRVTVVRDFPHARPMHSSNFHKDNDESDSLQIFIYLVDIDDEHGPLVYVPGSNHYDVRSCRPRLARDLGIDASDGRLTDDEVVRIYPHRTWTTLCTTRGTIAAIHGNGIHKGPSWPRPGDPRNQARTAIKLDLHGHKGGVVRDGAENRIWREDFERLSELQKLFAHATVVERPATVATRAVASGA
jgi:Phytanoyl-CoA dioxygenase (PhyH)